MALWFLGNELFLGNEQYLACYMQVADTCITTELTEVPPLLGFKAPPPAEVQWLPSPLPQAPIQQLVHVCSISIHKHILTCTYVQYDCMSVLTCMYLCTVHMCEYSEPIT